MIGIVGFFGLIAIVGLGVEIVRWTFRPAARRLRTIRKLGGRR